MDGSERADDSREPPDGAALADAIGGHLDADVTAVLADFDAAGADERTRALQALRDLAEDRPETVGPVLTALVPALTAEERPVRLTTAKLFVAVAAAVPEAVVPTVPALADRLADPDEFYFVRARSAEALGVLARTDAGSLPGADLARLDDDPFVAERVRFALAAGDGASPRSDATVGTVAGVRETTADAAAAVAAPDGDGDCPHCGLALPEGGPPMCPRCGAPR